MSGKPTFSYFGLPGRGMPCRLPLFTAFGKDGFVDDRWTFDKFGAEKKKFLENPSTSELVNSGSLPFITLANGKTITQSIAIARWAARQNKEEIGKDLYPAENVDDCLLIDEVMAVYEEIMLKCPHDKDDEARKAKREEYAEKGFLRIGCDLIAKRYKEKSNSGPFLCGSGKNPTLADLFVYAMVYLLETGMFDHVAKDYCDQWPDLVKAARACPESELAKAYLAAGLEF